MTINWLIKICSLSTHTLSPTAIQVAATKQTSSPIACTLYYESVSTIGPRMDIINGASRTNHAYVYWSKDAVAKIIENDNERIKNHIVQLRAVECHFAVLSGQSSEMLNVPGTGARANPWPFALQLLHSSLFKCFSYFISFHYLTMRQR